MPPEMIKQTEAALPASALASMPAVLRNAIQAYQSIKTYEDVEQFLLKGNGYSNHTLRSYLGSFRMFTEFTGAGSLFDVLPADIEDWFDEIAAKKEPRTAALRMAGVRAIYRNLERLLP